MGTNVRCCVRCCDRFGHAYDPELVLWNLSPHGPFASAEELKSSKLMQPLADGLRFTVVRTARVGGDNDDGKEDVLEK